MKGLVLIGLIVGVLALSGCAAATSTPGNSNPTMDATNSRGNGSGNSTTEGGANQSEVPSIGDTHSTLPYECGQEVIDTNHQGYSVTSRDCLWHAYSAGAQANFSTTAHTTEGDPITYRVRVISTNLVEVELNTTKDRLGKQGVTKYMCKSMERFLLPAGNIAGAISPRSLTFGDCTGGDAVEVHIPW